MEPEAGWERSGASGGKALCLPSKGLMCHQSPPAVAQGTLASPPVGLGEGTDLWREGRMPSLQGPHVPPKPTRCRARDARLAACRTWKRDGPLEGRHSAFPSVPSGTLLLRLPEEKRLSALGKAECLPSKGLTFHQSQPAVAQGRSPRRLSDLERDGPLEGRHSAFPSVPSGTLFLTLARRKAPVGAREGRMPSLQGLTFHQSQPAVAQGRSPRRLSDLEKGRAFGGRHPAFPSVPPGTLFLTLAPKKSACRR